MAAKFDTGIQCIGNLQVTGSITPTRPRAELTQDPLSPFPLPLTSGRVWNAIATPLGSAASDDLGISGGTWGTNSHYITAGDLKAAGPTTRYARFELVLPAEYQAGETVQLSFNAGMGTTVAGTSCTLDAEVFVNGEDSTIDGIDLVTTSATSINSVTFAPYAFNLTASGLSPGSILDLRIAIACNDAATVTTVEPIIGSITLLADIKG